MKIKCPFCVYEANHRQELASHLWGSHREMEKDRFIADKLFKIHEKIESFEYSENCRLADAYTGLQPDKVSKVLKSLLD